MNDFNNPVAVVTGGSRGIGAAIVVELVKHGFNVVLNYNKSEESAREIQRLYSDNIFIYKANVSSSTQVKEMIDFAYNKFGKIDLLVNNAGIDFVDTIDRTSNETFENIIKTNLFSAFFASKYASNYMVKAKNGVIVNISSIWGVTGASCEVAYSVSKAGMDGLTKALAKELGPSGIRVNSIAPGIIDTDMNSDLTESEIEAITQEIPLGRVGLPSEVAKSVISLYDLEYITGQVIQVNGGWNI